MTMYYSEARSLMASARHPENGKPLCNNTRLYERTRPDPRNRNRTITVYAVRLHCTNVVTIFPDFWELAAGGWTTPTTQSRINSYAPGRVGSNYRGDGWMLPIQDPAPEPEKGERSVPHPFSAVDPGPEPIKDPEGCVAGTEVELEFWTYDAVHPEWSFANDPDPSDPNALVYMANRYYSDGSGPRVRAHRAAIERIAYGEERWGRSYTNGIGQPRTEYKQCPHCAAFDARHDRWHNLMYGDRWGRTRGKGWVLYSKMMERYGSTDDAWLEAAREDLREVKAANQEWREWYYANHIAFHDGVRVGFDGRVLKKYAQEWFAAERRAERMRKRRQREQEAHERRQRHLARLKSGYRRRQAARRPRFETIAGQIASELNETRKVLATGAWREPGDE